MGEPGPWGAKGPIRKENEFLPCAQSRLGKLSPGNGKESQPMKKWIKVLWTSSLKLGVCFALASSAYAQTPYAQAPISTRQMPTTPQPPSRPDRTAPEAAPITPESTSASPSDAGAAPEGASAAGSPMFGDGAAMVDIAGVGSEGDPPDPTELENSLAQQRLAFIASAGAFKIAENESPRPMDRVYVTYNYFYNVNGSSNDVPGTPRTEIHRELIGGEKTFLDGNASIGLRLPFIQILGSDDVKKSDVGDLSVILKYAVLNNCDTGNLLSTGLVVTAPTGNSFIPSGVTPDIHPWLLQPFVGAIYHLNQKLYVHGFTSVVVPTNSQDPTLLFNDLGVVYVLYKDCDGGGGITSIEPTVEVHVTDPLNHRGPADPTTFGAPDIVDLTYGIRFGIGQSCNLGTSIVLPVTGPKPYDFEAMAQLNFKF